MVILMDKILVTVIVTTYDRPAKLTRALDSVISQTYKNIEILILDGKGLQKTQKIVRTFQQKDNRIVYIPTFTGEKTSVLYGSVQAARNIGLKHAQGKYIATLDDDDYWKPDKIEQQLFYAEIYNATLVSCYMEVHDNDFVHIDKPKLTPTYEDLLKSFNMSCTSSYFLNRNVLRDIGGFNESLRSMHEYDIALKLAKQGLKIIVVPEPLMTMTRDNAKDKEFYFIKIAEVFDLYRLYGRDMLKYLGARGFMFNVVKSVLLISLFLMGFLVKEKIWNIIFKLKAWYVSGQDQTCRYQASNNSFNAIPSGLNDSKEKIKTD